MRVASDPANAKCDFLSDVAKIGGELSGFMEEEQVRGCESSLLPVLFVW